MATTSIWSVKGRLDQVLSYAENSEKTETRLEDVLRYAAREDKTERKGKGAGEENLVLERYVSGIQCSPEMALEEMMAVKRRFGKTDGVTAYHGYQSFAPGECTPELAHEIGVKLAGKLWGDRFQVLVATHLDKENHLHNHFVVNTVSFVDGKKYHRTKQDYREMQEASDQLCREYGLSVIEKPEAGRTKHYGEWQAEQEGRPTYRGLIRADVDEAIREANTESQFFQILKEKGYAVKIGKDITLRPAGKERGLKLARNFGEAYTEEAICRRILETYRPRPPRGRYGKGEYGRTELPGPTRLRPVYRVRGGLPKKNRRIGGIRGLYLHYCFLLGILPKKRRGMTQKQLHFLLREDLRKLERISQETRLLCHHRIDTLEQLTEFSIEKKQELEQLVQERQHLRNRLRRKDGKLEEGEIKESLLELNNQIWICRREVRLCGDIAERSGLIREKMNRIYKKVEKEEKEHEHIRGSR